MATYKPYSYGERETAEEEFKLESPPQIPAARQVAREEGHDQMELTVPEKLNIGQYICLGVLYIIALLLLSFIIYYSFTWNKYRPNEYIWAAPDANATNSPRAYYLGISMFSEYSHIVNKQSSFVFNIF